MTGDLLTIGSEEIIGAPVLSTAQVLGGITALMRPGRMNASDARYHDVAEAMAKLLRENQELTQDLEDNKEDVVMYEQVARDVETKWMLSEEVISDLRMLVMKLIEAKKRKEKEVEAKALENAQMRIEIESMRKKMRRSSRGLLTANNRLEHLPLKPSRFCRRQTAISTKMMYAVLPLHHLYRTNSDQGYLARQRKDLRITPKVSIVSPAVAHEISIGDNEDIPESLNAFRPSRVAFYHAAVAAVQDAGVGCTCVYTTGNAVGVHDSSHTPHIWKTSVGRKRYDNSTFLLSCICVCVHKNIQYRYIYIYIYLWMYFVHIANDGGFMGLAAVFLHLLHTRSLFKTIPCGSTVHTKGGAFIQMINVIQTVA